MKRTYEAPTLALSGSAVLTTKGGGIGDGDGNFQLVPAGTLGFIL